MFVCVVPQLLLVVLVVVVAATVAPAHLIDWWLSLLILQNLFAPISVGEVMTNLARDFGLRCGA